ncbi:MAG: insulinase family protein [Bacteroidetes bacterium]|nr:insulinase family protein [Bacteroidota bacterium]
MIHFNEVVLANGLRILVHEDPATPLAAVNILYKVGARDEDPNKTGFAHLFEHFMFEGSVNIPEFDSPLQFASGENNAFTSNDITNYYDILPATNLETAFWLESDRMLSLDFNLESLETQKKVVCEEFKEHYINQPYGDVWHKLSALAYKVHPYQWPTIGKELSHVENATMEDAKAFFFKYYRPRNAVMVVAGGVKTSEVERLAKKWFSDIPSGELALHDLPKEPVQTEARILELHEDVPLNAIYKAYKMCDRLHADYQASDFIRDMLSTGESSRLYNELVKDKKIFSSVAAYLSETIDDGMFIVEGKLNPGISMDAADKAIEESCLHLADTVTEHELQKVKNKTEAYLIFSDTNVLNRAMNLAWYDMLGDPNDINKEIDKYLAVTTGQIRTVAQQIFDQNRCSTVRYFAKNK